MQYKRLLGGLSGGIITHGSCIITGDANMAMWCIVPELRARGIEISLCSWYPFTANNGDGIPHSDSCFIATIGPVEGVRCAYAPSHFNLGPKDPDLPKRGVIKLHQCKDDRGIPQGGFVPFKKDVLDVLDVRASDLNK